MSATNRQSIPRVPGKTFQYNWHDFHRKGREQDTLRRMQFEIGDETQQMPTHELGTSPVEATYKSNSASAM